MAAAYGTSILVLVEPPNEGQFGVFSEVIV